jgi:hypothetical protein
MNRTRVIWPVLSVCVLAFLMFSLGSTRSGAESPTPQHGVGFSLPAERNPAPLMAGDPVQSFSQAETPNLATTAPLADCRFGAATAYNSTQVSWLAPLGAGWYLDFASHTPSSLTNAEYVQVIRLHQNMDENCSYVPGYVTSPSLTEAGLGSVVAAHRGALWIIGNEPDRGPNPEHIGQKDSNGRCYRGQDDTMPEVYAQIYHDAYAFIKSHDPTARVANAGLVEVTPGRLQYLDKVWQAYLDKYKRPMPVDVWNIHLYVLPEARFDGQPNGIANVALSTDPALAKRESDGSAQLCSRDDIYCYAEHDDMKVFAEQIVAMRTWMAQPQHGQQNKPLILSEYSLLYPFQDYDDPVNPTTCWLQDEYGKCFTEARVQTFMTESLNYLDSASDPALGYPADGNRLVQRWLWFGVNFQSPGYVSDLLDDSETALTPLGELYQSSVANRTPYVNLRPDPVPPLSAYAPTGVTTASIAVSVYNIGTAPTADSFTVTFYSDSARKQPIGSAVVDPGLPGCEGRRVTATISWPNLSLGSHQFWAWIDSGESVAESNDDDNFVTGNVTIYPYRLHLPLVFAY